MCTSSDLSLILECNNFLLSNFHFLGLNLTLDLFSRLKQLWAARNRDISDFWIHNRGVDYILDEILDEVLSQISYKGDKDQLLKRIRRVARFKTFSIRDRKLLKKLVEAQKQKHGIDLSQLEYLNLNFK